LEDSRFFGYHLSTKLGGLASFGKREKTGVGKRVFLLDLIGEKNPNKNPTSIDD
jgi:hypothetical protein